MWYEHDSLAKFILFESKRLKADSEISQWQATPIFIKSEMFTFLHLCELKSERNFESMPLLNYKSAMTSDVWKKSMEAWIQISFQI